MAEKKVNVRHQQKVDTASNWTAKNPTLMLGEIGVESDTEKVKIGDGKTAWGSLPYTIGTAVPQNAKFTDTTYTVATQTKDGLLSASDKVKYDGAVDDAAGALADAADALAKVNSVNTVVVQNTQPTDDNAVVWINPDEDASYKVAEINDDIISPDDTWSSSKINSSISVGGGNVTIDLSQTTETGVPQPLSQVMTVNGQSPDSTGNIVLTYDSALDANSTNAVQNKVVLSKITEVSEKANGASTAVSTLDGTVVKTVNGVAPTNGNVNVSHGSKQTDIIVNLGGTTVASSTYGFSSALVAGDILMISLRREGEWYYYPNFILYPGSNINVVIQCAPNNNNGATMYNKCTISNTGISLSTWYCGFEYTGSLANNLCTGMIVYRFRVNL